MRYLLQEMNFDSANEEEDVFPRVRAKSDALTDIARASVKVKEVGRTKGPCVVFYQYVTRSPAQVQPYASSQQCFQ